MSKSKDSEDVLSLLDSLGDSAVPPPSSTDTVPVTDPASTENEKELLGFLDDLAKQPARSTTPRPTTTRTSRDSARTGNVTKKSPEKVVEKPAPAPVVTEADKAGVAKNDGSGWLGGLWNMGSAAIKTAEQKMKELQQTEEAKALEERVRGNVSVLGKFGIS